MQAAQVPSDGAGPAIESLMWCPVARNPHVLGVQAVQEHAATEEQLAANGAQLQQELASAQV